MAMTQAEFDALIAKIRANPTQSGYGNGIGLGATGGAYMDQASGKGLIPLYAMGQQNGEDGYTPGEQIGWRDQDTADSMAARNKSILNGRDYNNWDMDGNVTGTGKWSGLKKGSAEMQFITAAAMMAAPFAAAVSPGVNAALSFGVNPVTGGAASGGLGGFAGAADAVTGMIPSVGNPAAAAGTAGASGTFNAAMDSQAANVGIDAAGGNALSGYQLGGTGGVTASPIGGTGASTSTSLLDKAKTAGSSLLNNPSALGAAATALGGASGGGGGSGSGSAKMDSRLDNAVYGENGLVPRSQSLLAQQMSLERMAEWAKVRSQGMSLLNQPVAGNPFMDGRRTLFR